MWDGWRRGCDTVQHTCATLMMHMCVFKRMPASIFCSSDRHCHLQAWSRFLAQLCLQWILCRWHSSGVVKGVADKMDLYPDQDQVRQAMNETSLEELVSTTVVVWRAARAHADVLSRSEPSASAKQWCSRG